MDSNSKHNNKSALKMRVLALQELKEVSGGTTADEWSTNSLQCVDGPTDSMLARDDTLEVKKGP